MAKVDKEYNRLLRTVLENGKSKSSRAGDTLSIFSEQVKFDLEKEFPILTTKKMAWKSIVSELLWFLSGSTDIRDLWKHGNHIWDGDYNKSGRNDFKLGPIYSKQWVNLTNYSKPFIDQDTRMLSTPQVIGINQIQNTIDLLKNNPDSRRILVNSWNVSDLSEMVLPPCHWAFELYTEELTEEERVELIMWTGMDALGERSRRRWMDENNVPKRRLHLKFHQRSCDLPLGIPFNITSYALLLHMFTQQVNMVPGTLIGDLTNVHIYKNQIAGIEEQLKRDTDKHKAPKLKLNKASDMFSYTMEDFQLEGYESYPTIKIPLSN